MTVRIRLARGGTKKRPFYRIVATSSHSPRDGGFLEKLGTYNPILPSENPQRIVLREERIRYWLGVGAQPSDRVARFLDNAGITESATRWRGTGKKAEEIAAKKAEPQAETPAAAKPEPVEAAAAKPAAAAKAAPEPPLEAESGPAPAAAEAVISAEPTAKAESSAEPPAQAEGAAEPDTEADTASKPKAKAGSAAEKTEAEDAAESEAASEEAAEGKPAKPAGDAS